MPPPVGAEPTVAALVKATLVAPRSTSDASSKVTKTRVVAGENGTGAELSAKIPNVGVPPFGMSKVTEAAGALRQAPVAGSVWQIVSVTGRVAIPVLAETV